jgi:AcrR family transcriptional regulator
MTMTVVTSTPSEREFPNEMNALDAKLRPRRTPSRPGRPPKELASEIEGRVLDAAREIFLARGFEGASVDEIAEKARAGKQTIYSRFPNKAALFTAMVMRDVARRMDELRHVVPAGETLEERLIDAGITAVSKALVEQRIGLLRLAIAEAQRFPDLASKVSHEAYALSTEAGVQLLREIAKFETLQAFAPEHLAVTARFFLDLVVVPFLFRAVFAPNLEDLRAEIEEHTKRSVAFFVAACRDETH